ncbi:unnamed protein product [Nippostrongylus brasiliensis]|uniref:Ig-like domain-containing protein n=1 Tax=Nippostrongylus brasiliensis TaxID=27835 RepID=A0A0N4YTC5_NIPBR|nr:unnamed protein product [Nippostrongylus brasiliensis]
MSLTCNTSVFNAAQIPDIKYPSRSTTGNSDDLTTADERNTGDDTYPCFPGFVFDPVTRKHFRIAPEGSGVTNYTRKDIARSRREKERCEQLALGRAFINPASCRVSRTTPTAKMVSDCALGIISNSWVRRSTYENRLLRTGTTPNAVQETPLGSSREHVKGCQFLELVGNGEDCNVLGCWAIGDGSRNSRNAAKLACLRVNFDDKEAEKTASKIDEALPLSTCSSFNTLGLDFSLNGESVDVTQPVLVDMAVAPVDSDVTCVLYVTAESRMTDEGRIASVCNVVLQPMSALCSDDDDFEVRNSPIYNIQWSVESSAIYSCAWNSNKTRIALDEVHLAAMHSRFGNTR